MRILISNDDGIYSPGLAALRWTRQSFRHYDGKVVPGQDPMGRKNFWFTVVPIEDVEEGSDRWAVENDFVSMTPLRVELTDNDQLRRLQSAAPAPAST